MEPWEEGTISGAFHGDGRSFSYPYGRDGDLGRFWAEEGRVFQGLYRIPHWTLQGIDVEHGR